MTVNEVLARSSTGAGVRKYNDTFRQVITRGRQAFFVTNDGRATECPWPEGGENWGILLLGKTLESVQSCGRPN